MANSGLQFLDLHRPSQEQPTSSSGPGRVSGSGGDPEGGGGLLAPLPLDRAVARSIESCPSEESRRRAWGTLLLVGGAARTAGLAALLESRIALLVRESRST